MMSEKQPITIVTGASSNHFRCLQNLLYSIRVFEPHANLVVYDLGLSAAESAQLQHERIDLRRFEFDRYPIHVNIRYDRGEYAWKPIIVADTLHECGGISLWLDAGNLVHSSLDGLLNIIKSNGLYTPTSSGTVRQWTHRGTLDYLRTCPSLLDKPNRNAAVVGLRADCPLIEELVNRWKACALDVTCIAPLGSHRGNHRQDQAVLTVLVYQLQAEHNIVLEDALVGISTHNDVLNLQQVKALLHGGASFDYPPPMSAGRSPDRCDS